MQMRPPKRSSSWRRGSDLSRMVTSAPSAGATRCVQTDHAATDNGDLGRQHAGHAAQRMPRPPLALCSASDLPGWKDRPATSTSVPKRQAATVVGDRLVGDAGHHARRQQALGLPGVRRQMQIGVEWIWPLRAQPAPISPDGCGSLDPSRSCRTFRRCPWRKKIFAPAGA